MTCDKKTLIELKNLFMSQWFNKPNHHFAQYHYMLTFVYQRGEIDGNSEKRYFNGKYFSDDCIDTFYRSDFTKIIKADEDFDKNLK